MKRLNPVKLHVSYLAGAIPEKFTLPRCYTLTHSDRTGDLFLSIGTRFEAKQVAGLYTRLMRDEVLAEFIDKDGNPELRVYCHVSGGFILGTAKWRYDIFRKELPLVLEAIRYGDRIIFEENPELDNCPVSIVFKSTNDKFNRVEAWGVTADYR